MRSFRIDRAPADYLREAGSIFAVFDRQDSGNVSYGVEWDGERLFVKTAGSPERAERRWALLRNAARIGQAYRHEALPRLRGAGKWPATSTTGP
ncbi:hypothetical protein ACQP2X_27825 [Actinoplanes sp. CA-131856]